RDGAPGPVGWAGGGAARVGGRNGSLVVGDRRDPAAAGAGAAAFDQLVAVTALADAGLYPHDPPEARRAFSSVADVDGPGRAFRSSGVETLVGHLGDGGRLLAFDRTPDASLAVRLGAAL